MTVPNPEATKARADLEAAISAAMPFASHRVRAALTRVVDELARIDKKNSLFEGHAPERCSAALIERVPELAGFGDVFVSDGHLHIEVRHIEDRRCHMTPQQRVAAVHAAAAVLGGEVRAMAGGTPRQVQHWTTGRFQGRLVIVAATICECHDGLEHTLGQFEDRGQVIAAASGAALRDLADPDLHPGIAAAETAIDVEQALRPGGS